MWTSAGVVVLGKVAVVAEHLEPGWPAFAAQPQVELIAGPEADLPPVRIAIAGDVVDDEELRLGLVTAGALIAVARGDLCAKRLLRDEVFGGLARLVRGVFGTPFLVPGPLVRGSIIHTSIITHFARNVNKENA